MLLTIYLILPFFPWWILWIILVFYGWFAKDFKRSIFCSSVIALISWGMKLVIGYLMGGSVLMARIANMLGLGSTFYLILLSLILAGVLGGLSGASGYHIKQLAHSFFPHLYSNK